MSWVEGCVGVPNESGGYHGILERWWVKYGFGDTCILIGEGKSSKEFFMKRYPEVHFITANISSNDKPDIVWDICRDIPEELVPFINKIGSILCQAVFEHVIDPVGAMRNFVRLLKPNGFIFLHAAGCNFVEHRHPIDCIRLLNDWFNFLPLYIPDIKLIDSYNNGDRNMFAVYQKILS